MSLGFDSYMQAMLWTCTSCGFVFQGGQPKMECPACEAYKSAFVDLPQHLEREIRTEFEELPPNHRDCRKRRLELMEESGVQKNARFAGRILPSASGNFSDPSHG